MLATATTGTSFQLPPQTLNARGRLRRAGFEFEFAGLTLDASADVVRGVFGGVVENVSPSVRKVQGTEFGDFSIEIDSSVVKDKRYQEAMRAIGLSPENWNTDRIELALMGILSTWVPFEIGTPPLPMDQLQQVDRLRERLCEAGAKGTRTSFRYAFGMHINPELPSDDPASIRDHLRAFLLLQPWLQQRVEVDLTRKVMPFINPFPVAYTRRLLQADYPASADRLIDDYLEHNPTRNRPLDLLPVLAHLDADRVKSRVEDPHLVKARPAYHYRLPNCLIDEPDWSIAREWNTWVAVERLATDEARLAEMSRDYLEADELSVRPFLDKWPRVLEQYIDAEQAERPA
jgi:hypothetical protein